MLTVLITMPVGVGKQGLKYITKSCFFSMNLHLRYIKTRSQNKLRYFVKNVLTIFSLIYDLNALPTPQLYKMLFLSARIHFLPKANVPSSPSFVLGL